ncbi:hypothetical protein OKA04_24240 [Luteolibacter flavescens]|uniref:DUF3592 domain-containing protein n=1 Tax=Luteolibacter flavescens TaxID=1859460 RepID=A0ABT3FWB3_9BACT|nr:hypothetical protein [Luteolibacter flavescens]MCW1887870.1 hypothetical protein [Luteolibacter flavescens]
MSRREGPAPSTMTSRMTMTPRPLRRSLTFWAGLFVILSLGVGWWHSCRHTAYIDLGRYGASSTDRAINIHHMVSLSTPVCGLGSSGPHKLHKGSQHQPFPQPFLIFAAEELQSSDYDIFREAGPQPQAKPDPSRFKRSKQFSVSFFGHGSWMLYLPYWIILLCFLPFWGFLLHLRHRRVRRAAASMPVP